MSQIQVPDAHDVLFEREGYVATIVLNRPAKLNAVTPAMAARLIELVARCNADSEVRAVILTAAGDKAFCAGSDIAELDDYASPWDFRNRPDYCDAIRRLGKPAICAINGYALGGGLETALSCDIRLAATHARFGAPEIKLGWIGGGGMSYLLAHSIGPSNAALMLMTGDPIDAARALAWGLVSEVLEFSELRLRAVALAQAIAARAPIAAETAKTNLRAAFAVPLETAVQYERDLQTICFATEDAKEGRNAFKQKRAPHFNRR
jgi:enoyl-CoA hydratase/carnithine racemase